MELLFITIGISGSGKSTFFKNGFESFLKESGLDKYKPRKTVEQLTVEPDNFRRILFGDVNYDHSKERWLWGIVEEALKFRLANDKFAILDSVMVSGRGRNSFIKNFPDAKKVALVFKCDLEESWGRIRNDISWNIDRSNVPRKILEGQYKNYVRSVVGEQDYENFVWSDKIKNKIENQLKDKFDIIKIIE